MFTSSDWRGQWCSLNFETTSTANTGRSSFSANKSDWRWWPFTIILSKDMTFQFSCLGVGSVLTLICLVTGQVLQSPVSVSTLAVCPCGLRSAMRPWFYFWFRRYILFACFYCMLPHLSLFIHIFLLISSPLVLFLRGQTYSVSRPDVVKGD